MKKTEQEKEPYIPVALGLVFLAVLIKAYFYFGLAGFLTRIALYAPTPLLFALLLLAGYLVKKLGQSWENNKKNHLNIGFFVFSLSFVMTPLFYFLV